MGEVIVPQAAKQLCIVCTKKSTSFCPKCHSPYCGKECQKIDWPQHRKKCESLAAEHKRRSSAEDAQPMQIKTTKEAPPVVSNSNYAKQVIKQTNLNKAIEPMMSSTAEISDLHQSLSRSSCSICLEKLPIIAEKLHFYVCCCQSVCNDCAKKCVVIGNDERCPLCRAPSNSTAADYLSKLLQHVKQGSCAAQKHFGDLYCTGSLVKKSAKRAAEYWELAAKQGHVESQVKIGLCYQSGEGVKLDTKIAIHYFRLAADQGSCEGQFNLGKAYNFGKGVAQSADEAVRWYKLAAAQGHADAQFNLGFACSSGQGVAQSADKAVR